MKKKIRNLKKPTEEAKQIFCTVFNTQFQSTAKISLSVMTAVFSVAGAKLKD